jgi:DNA-binding LacI/PurR family transcriptional regulator
VTDARRATSADVARRAGVCRATVSHGLNSSTRHSIPDTTRDRILAAAADLGYAPHAAARALRRGRSGSVLVVLSDVPLGTSLATLLAGLTHGVAGLGLSAVTWTRGVGQPLRDVLAHLVPQVAVTSARLPAARAPATRGARVR